VADESHLRIGELSRRAGVSPELLRAWERRYELLEPTRSPGGLRLYSLEDLERVRLMARHIADGVAAREAAVLATRADLRGPARADARPERAVPMAAFDANGAAEALHAAVESFDEPALQTTIDGLLAAATIDAVLAEVIVPFLREIGERWEGGEVSVAQEHFITHVLRSRLLSLGRGWGGGTGPRALLACPPGEQHDLGLIAFGLALRARGWRIDFLGADTPVESLSRAVAAMDPDLVVVSATTHEVLRPILDDLAGLASDRTVGVAGAGAAAGASPDGVLTLPGDPVGEAAQVTALISRS
jgi:DNA-binding transcriptional MerR regulator